MPNLHIITKTGICTFSLFFLPATDLTFIKKPIFRFTLHEINFESLVMQKTKWNFSHFIYSNKRSSKYLFYEQNAQTWRGENCFVPKNMKNWMCVYCFREFLCISFTNTWLISYKNLYNHW
jgi:hypothetical protein